MGSGDSPDRPARTPTVGAIQKRRKQEPVVQGDEEEWVGVVPDGSGAVP